MRLRRGRADPTTAGPLTPLALACLSGGATAGVAGYYLPAVWKAAARCPGPGHCTAPAFWGFSPEISLLADAVGLVAGAATVALGVFIRRGTAPGRPAGLAVAALGVVGLIAYGGFGVGAAAGVAAGAIFASSKSRRTQAPTEWSGSLPVGVPPVTQGSRRVMTTKPPVTEWEGVFENAPNGPPGLAGRKVSLPPADRLAAALEKSRVAGTGPATTPPPVVVLPPPPIGLRGVYRGATIPPVPPPSPEPQIPVASRGAPLFVPPLPEAGADRDPDPAWKPHPSELAPWSDADLPSDPDLGSSTTMSLPEIAAALRPARPSSRAPSNPPASRASRPSTPAQRSPPRPMREFVVPALPKEPQALSGSSSAASAPTSPPLPATTETWSAVAPPPPRTGPPPVPRVPAAPTAVLPRPSGPEPAMDRPSLPPPPTFQVPAPVSVAPVEPDRSGTAPVPHAKGLSRAWKCPACGLVNAPWSTQCTGCKAGAPSVG